jgi:hypothetical protein
MRIPYITLAIGIIAILAAAPGHSQQVTVGTPFRTQQDHFFENSNINWNGVYRGYNGFPVTFSFGAPNLSLPQFGSPQTTAGLSTNFAILGKNGQINFGLNFGQGYTQSSTSQVPSVTIMNGQTGYISDTSQTPFVISVVPVVGAFPIGPQQLQEASGIDPSAPDPRIQALLQAHSDAQLQAAAQAAAQAQLGGVVPPLPQLRPNNPEQKNDPAPAKVIPGAGNADRASSDGGAAGRLSVAQESSAGRPAVSVAEAKRLHEQEVTQSNGEMAALMERAKALEEDGKPNVAKIYYQRIAKHGSGELQQEARTRLYELQGTK